jgi:GT2 family glycosyltransferase
MLTEAGELPTVPSHTTALTVSVVVCAYTERRWESLCRAVASVRRQTYPPLQTLLVIDNNPALLVRSKQAFEGVEVTPSNGEPGLSAARNTGLSMAHGDIVAFLDDDATAEQGWLGELVRAYESPHVVGAGGVATPRWEGASAPGWLPSEFYWTVGCSYRGLPTRIAPVRNPIGACMSFRRVVFDRIDGFVTGIGRVGSVPLGCEETELSIRARRAGVGTEVVHVPSARVEHLVPAERQTWRYFRSRCWAEGRSKALVARQVGSDDALSSEWSYTLKTLPIGIVRGFSDLLRGDPMGPVRAAAIAAGFLITVAGYLRGRLARAR